MPGFAIPGCRLPGRLLQLATCGYSMTAMNTPTPIYDYVLACLSAKVIPQRQVATGAGVPFSTVTKIAQCIVTNPSVHTVQKLYDYFSAQRAAFPALPQGAADKVSA